MSLQQKKLLVIDDEENMRHMLTALLSRSGYIVDTATDGEDGLGKVKAAHYDFILCDLKMPKMGGMTFLEKARDWIGQSTVIMMSAYGTIDSALEAMKLGAYDYISKPFRTDEVYLTLRKAEERERLKKENDQLKEQIRTIEDKYNFGKMVAKSKAMKDVFDLARKAGRYNTTVLITGESGTGKELVAKGIHSVGTRSSGPFIPVNCGGIPENLLESEFFGYKKGAFTGADRDKIGLFEEAQGGTIFLDEVGELPLSLQVKLLRVLQESEIRRLGDTKEKKIDVRVIAATARSLEMEVRNKTFRQDLYYRLNVLSIHLPALRDRWEDIPHLARFFIDRYNKVLGKEIQGIASDAMSILLNHSWPGNVRELENAIERGVILSEKSMIEKENLPLSAIDETEKEPFENMYDGFSIKQAQRILEKNLIEKALKQTQGNKTQAGRLLEISHPSLLTKIKAYNIETSE